jgi:hypothetical protein
MISIKIIPVPAEYVNLLKGKCGMKVYRVKYDTIYASLANILKSDEFRIENKDLIDDLYEVVDCYVNYANTEKRIIIAIVKIRQDKFSLLANEHNANELCKKIKVFGGNKNE